MASRFMTMSSQALSIVMQAVIMALITSMFMPAGRIIMCIVACAISTMFEHMAQHVAVHHVAAGAHLYRPSTNAAIDGSR